jgi:hypothetical protein
LTNQQYLNKEPFQLFQESLAETGDGVMVGVGVGAEIPIGDRVVGAFSSFRLEKVPVA